MIDECLRPMPANLVVKVKGEIADLVDAQEFIAAHDLVRQYQASAWDTTPLEVYQRKYVADKEYGR